MFKHLVVGDGESADSTKDFYDEYRSVCDMTAEFYLQTVDVVFQRHLLPKGELSIAAGGSIRRRSATPRCWRSRASATTFRASARPRPRSTSRPSCRKREEAIFLAKDVGHYGIFNGRKWREKIAPVVEKWIAFRYIASRKRPTTAPARLDVC
jgi:poly(3-hydroxybutyrate) depolymerase